MKYVTGRDESIASGAGGDCEEVKDIGTIVNIQDDLLLEKFRVSN